MAKRFHRSERPSVPFEDFLTFYDRVAKMLSGKTTQHDMMKLIGYSGGSHLSAWKQEGKVPLVAFNAVRWVDYYLLMQRKHVEAEPKEPDIIRHAQKPEPDREHVPSDDIAAQLPAQRTTDLEKLLESVKGTAQEAELYKVIGAAMVRGWRK